MSVIYINTKVGRERRTYKHTDQPTNGTDIQRMKKSQKKKIYSIRIIFRKEMNSATAKQRRVHVRTI